MWRLVEIVDVVIFWTYCVHVTYLKWMLFVRFWKETVSCSLQSISVTPMFVFFPYVERILMADIFKMLNKLRQSIIKIWHQTNSFDVDHILSLLLGDKFTFLTHHAVQIKRLNQNQFSTIIVPRVQWNDDKNCPWTVLFQPVWSKIPQIIKIPKDNAWIAHRYNIYLLVL